MPGSAELLQILAALTILNVWTLRLGRATPYRGGDARTMKEEFAVYGLPPWAFPLVGVLKLGSAAGLLLGLWLPGLTEPSALLLGGLMAGAVAMHVKVGDPVRKALPAAGMLGICAWIVLG